MLYEDYSSKGLVGYYDKRPIEIENLFRENNINGQENPCKRYIDDHFELGQKSAAMEISYYNKYEENGKHEHTVSLYLLGLYLEDLFKERLKENINELIPTDENETKRLKEKYVDYPIGDNWYNADDYKYSWFMTALYHDIASCVEKTKNVYRSCCEICEGEKILSDIIKEEDFHRYTMATVKAYCKYRKDDDKQDHGIIGGMQLYKKLRKNYDTCESVNRMPYIDRKRGLVWRKEHLIHYRYVADAIISHNMWTVPSSNRTETEKYRKYGLDDLIINSDERKLSIDKYPLHFMLCFLDTIEPVKNFELLSARDVLKNISIQYRKDEEKAKEYVVIEWNEIIERQPQFWKWIESITNMSDWMDVRVSKNIQSNSGSRNSITVDIISEDEFDIVLDLEGINSIM